MTSAGDRRWRHLSLHGRRAVSCGDGSVVLVVEELGDQLGAEAGAAIGAGLHRDVLDGERLAAVGAGDLGGTVLAAAVVAQPNRRPVLLVGPPLEEAAYDQVL
jgi:hypothetical protein